MPEVFVKSFTHLKDRPKADQALPLLQRVASLVKPIMRKHGWTLPVLAEFFPESPNLVGLNINGGQKILLRLRPAHAPDTFFEEDDIVHVMLHELTHNVHGPHNDEFYKYLAGLEDEYDALKRSGYSGEGFFSKGQRLGTNVSHNLPAHLARQRALEAAEKRRRLNFLMSGGGRLGGIRSGKSPRQLAAEAAERRTRDDKACASGATAAREAEKAAKESVEDKVIDLTLDSDSEPEVVISDSEPSAAGTPIITVRQTDDHSGHSSSTGTPKRRPVRSMRSGKPSSSRTPPPSPSASISRHGPAISRPAIPPSSDGEWACPRCTLVNDALNLQCAACLLVRPPVEDRATPEGWTCLACGEADNPHQFWSCRFCGSIKPQSVLG
ncbi:WLM domain-containing protein [Sparassis latifolia]|uniref:DNA-dependent metalloprotease WSS1 n=1 Tax=Sparassis crispa TaxID=139825 RepID=A0A401G5V5_9APHY|nr:DNA-dependent metalloprotease WSS1 [Sparassis crispa]GBE77546.1 DNA-dependent metalloprotease WSS1 [Sparassis crispa]